MGRFPTLPEKNQAPLLENPVGPKSTELNTASLPPLPLRTNPTSEVGWIADPSLCLIVFQRLLLTETEEFVILIIIINTIINNQSNLRGRIGCGGEMRRKIPLVTGNTYHVCAKSIAGFKIFNAEADYLRMLSGIRFFRTRRPGQSLSWLLRNDPGRIAQLDTEAVGSRRVQLIAYCIMSTHFHLLLRQKEDGGISAYLSHLQNSYARYFNIKHRRKGHLWEAAFKNVQVETDEQALHTARYIHLNPVTASLCAEPGEWKFSSWLEYLGKACASDRLCEFDHFPVLSPSKYEKFVADRIDYQRMLAQYKQLHLEDPVIP